MANSKDGSWDGNTSLPMSIPTKTKPSREGLPANDKQVCTPPDWADKGVSSASFPEGTNRPDVSSSIYRSTKSYTEVFSSLADFRAFPDDFLIINDVYLTDVPTTSISIQSKSDVFVGETLRSPAPIIASEGRESLMVQISLAFPPGLPQTRDLKRLMSTLLVNPFVYLHNNRIKKAIGVGEFETTMFALESGNLRSTSDTVGVIILDLVLYFFNYHPFSKHHYYNAKMYGVANPKDTSATTEDLGASIDLNEMIGYEPSSHSLSILSQDVQKKLRSGITYLKKASKQNVPVFLPSESDSWMYYADNLENTMPAISPYPGDFVGFSVKEFISQIPPNNSATDAQSTISDLLNMKYKPVHDVYNIEKGKAAKATTPPPKEGISQGWSSAVNSAVASTRPPTKDDPGIEGVTAKTIRFKTRKAGGDSAEVQLFDDNGVIIQSSLQRVHEIGNKHINPKDKLPPTSPDLLRLVQQIANHYPGREWEILRIGSVPGGTKYSTKSGHSAGMAMDFKISGVSIFSVWEWAKKNLSQAMIGVYPNVGFLHIEYRPSYAKAYYYIELSGNGGEALYVNTADPGKLTGHDVQIGGMQGKQITDAWWTQHRSEYIKEAVKEDNQETSKEIAANKQAKQNQEADKAAQRSPSIQEAVKQANTNIENYAKGDTTVKSVEQKDYKKRIEWIEGTEVELSNAFGAPAYYYYDDPKIRNTFYVERAYDISSDPSLQSVDKTISNGSVLPNMVCTAISVSFGHRIAPMRCVGNPSPAWQFLGAGNKSGQIVLTFSGEEGKRSADYLKQNILAKSRESARIFGSIIKEAGTIELRHTQYSTGDQNTILALTNIKNIIVTGFEEFTSSESTDKWQLVIEFLAQEFAEETIEQRFSTTVDSKKAIVKAVMSKLFAQPYKNAGQPKVRIRPDASIAYNNPNPGRPYIVNAQAPAWLANIVVRAADICNKYEQDMPPLVWKIPDGSRTWADIYNEWGAGRLFLGSRDNVSSDEREKSEIRKRNVHWRMAQSEPYQEEKAIWESEDKGIFKFNGGVKTNHTHEQVMERWLTEMEFIVREVKSNLSNEDDFKKYFPGLAEAMIDQITIGFGACYNDMQLPVIPGTAIPLPPEFYVYDDSSEDPFMANMTDPTNMEKELEGHVLNEFESIKQYLTGTLLGGSYLSKNMPKIRKQRLLELERTEAQKDYDYYYKLAEEGTKTWEPVYFRGAEARTDENSTIWSTSVARKFGEGTKEQQTLKFLESASKLTASSGVGRNWDESESANNPNNEELVRKQYGDAASAIAFGPSSDYAKTDEYIKGNVPFPGTDGLKAFDKNLFAPTSAEQFKEITKNALKNIGPSLTKVRGVEKKATPHPTVNTATTLPDGTVTVGQTADEKETESPGIWRQLMEIAWSPWEAPDKLGNNNEKALAAQKFETEEFKKYNHPIMEKLGQAQEAKNQAKAASRFALTKRASDLSMRRAYPTFKIYFIEDDSDDSEAIQGKFLRSFDDFYSYSAIQEIRITRSRKVAGDLAIIRMTNIGGMLLRRRFGEMDRESSKKGKGGEQQGIFADTEKEHPFEKMILQDGVKVQIRLGYSANPDHLTSVFLGQIVEISPSEDTKILEIMCQGYGAELDHVELGPLENGPLYYSTQQALSAAIIQESIVTFGRQDRWNQDNATIARHAWTGGQGLGIIGSLTPSNIMEEWSNLKLDSLFKKYKFKNKPQDDNIYAPPPTAYTTVWTKFWNNACIFRPLKQTCWEIFKEHELRHPGYISMAVPYGHDTRMTMFFGSKMQHYWSRPPSQLENQLAESASKDLVRMGGIGVKVLNETVMKQLSTLAGKAPAIAEAIMKDAMSFGVFNHVGFAMGEFFGRYIPFRSYLYFDSYHHILKNEIRTSVDGTFNEIEVRFSEDEGGIDKEDAKETADNAKAVAEGESGILTCKLDENIPDYATRSITVEYPSCVTSDMARRYAQGLFGRYLRDAYKGEFIVIGEERIKPYDVAFINDASINMYGPVEVEAVTHIFNRDNGFVSVITPDLCLEVNDYYTVSSFDVTAGACQMTWADPGLLATSVVVGGGLGGLPGTAAVYAGVTALKGIGFLAAWAGVKFAMWSQDGAPVIATPLSFGGKPFISMSLGPNKTSLIIGLFGKWKQYWDDLGDAWHKFDLAEEFFERRINMAESIYTFIGGAGASGGGELLTKE